MALTKKDFENIQKALNQGIVQAIDHLVMPAFNAFDKRLDSIDNRLGNVEDRLGNVEDRLGRVEDQLTGLKGDVKDLKGRLDEHIVITSERFDETTALIGYYFEKCASKEEIRQLTRRVEVLEARA